MVRHGGFWWLAAGVALLLSGCSDDAVPGDDSDNEAGRGSPDAGRPARDAGRDSGADDAGMPSVGEDSWPMMGHDPNNTYFNSAETSLTVENAPTLIEKWRFTVAGYPPGSPAVADGKVFVMATGGTYALDLATGAMLWARNDVAGTASAAYDAGFVYVHTRAADLLKLNASDGATVWGPVRTYELSGCDGTSSPIVAGGAVVVGHSCGGREVGVGYEVARGGVEAFDVETGARTWSYYTVPETGENGAMVWSSVAIDPEGSTVFATTGNNYSVGGPNSDAFHAIDLMNGEARWKLQVRANDVWSSRGVRTGQDTDFGANPILVELGGQKLVAAGDKGSAFWALDRETGAIVWERQALTASHTPANGGVLMNGAFDGDDFYVVSNDPTAAMAVLYRLDGETGADVWSKAFPKINWGAPSLANGVLAVPFGDDLYVLDAETGETLTMFATGGTIAAGAAAIAQGRLIVQSGLTYPFGSVTLNNQVICYGLPD
jgi:polyvinyl alcohol dehydrogenase (cytochrome)